MPKFFVKSNQINDNRIVIEGQDVNHIAKVLRMKIGDELNVCNTDTAENYKVKLSKIEGKFVECTIAEKLNSVAEASIDLTVFQGIPKADKMELIIQKSTELGVKKIVPVEMERCVSKIAPKDVKKKIERWSKIAEVAAKQSKRDMIPKVEGVIKIEQLCELVKEFDIIIVPYENESTVTLKQILRGEHSSNIRSIGVVIGPEGGFDEKEIEMLETAGAKIVTLGRRILRTETVALVMAGVIMYELGGNE